MNSMIRYTWILTLKTQGKSGKEVVQLYVNDKVSSMVTPVKQLRDFRKVSVKAGETKTVKLKVAVNDLYMVTADNKEWSNRESLNCKWELPPTISSR